MKKVAAIIFLILSAGCFAYINLLTAEDWDYLQEDNARPAITIPGSGESFYNEWTCHVTEDLAIEVVQVVYNNKEMGSPTIFAEDGQKIIEYALDPEPMEFSNIIESRWKELITGTEEVCFVSAFLQNSPGSELRIVQRIKTQQDIWDWFEESANFRGPQRDDI